MRIFGASCVLVGELLPERESIRTLAFWLNGSLQRGIVYSLRGTPCDEALRNSVCHVPDKVAEQFPEAEMLSKLGMRGYMGAPLKDGNGNAIGVLSMLHHQPLEAGGLEHSLLAAFAARAGTELERIRAQEELERTRDFLRNTLNAVPDPLFVMDRAHRWVVVNRAFCDFMGRAEAELLGSTARDFFPARVSAAFFQQDERLFTTGESIEAERVFEHTRDGQARTIVTKKAVFPSPAGAPSSSRPSETSRTASAWRRSCGWRTGCPPSARWRPAWCTRSTTRWPTSCSNMRSCRRRWAA